LSSTEVVVIDTEAQKTEVAKISVESKKSLTTLEDNLKKLEVIAKAASDRVETAKTRITAVAENASDLVKAQAQLAANKLKSLEAKEAKILEVVDAFKESVAAAQAEQVAIEEHAKNFNAENTDEVAQKAAQKTAYAGINDSNVKLEAISKEAGESVKEILENDASEKLIASNAAKKAAAAKIAELEVNAANFFKQNQTTLATGFGVSVTGLALGAAAIPVAGFALPFAAIAGLSTLAVAGVKTAMNHVQASKSAA
jgi:hypothetical protein